LLNKVVAVQLNEDALVMKDRSLTEAGSADLKGLHPWPAGTFGCINDTKAFSANQQNKRGPGLEAMDIRA
jgi:hypothetical protein